MEASSSYGTCNTEHELFHDLTTIDAQNPRQETATAEIMSCKASNSNDDCEETVGEDNAIAYEDEGMEANRESILEPYSYTKRANEFTSEIFKIEIANLPKFFGYKQFKKLLVSNLNFSPVKIKAIPHSGFAFVTFRNEEERQKALTTFDKFKWKGRQLITKLAKALPDPVASKRAKQELKSQKLKKKLENSITRAGTLGRKRLQSEEASCIDNKRAKPDEVEEEQTPTERLNNFVTPLWKTPYSEQIKIKFQFIMDTLQRLTDSLNEMTEEKNSRLEKEHSEERSVTCELMPCIPSPVFNGYRNKCEFTIAEGPDQEKTVGFRVGNYKDGFSGVIEPSECIHISDTAKRIANIFQKFVRQSSLDVFDLCLHTGYWQTLTVRNTDLGESMAIIQFNPQTLSQPELDNLFQEIREFFTHKEGKECKLSSLYIQVNPSRSMGGIAQEPKLLFGIPCIHEILHAVKFRISPDAFFQVNIQAAEKMFDIMKEWMGDCSSSTLLDICCGTGTIGLCLAKYISKVIGIELVGSAVEDAKKNAEMNDITNAEFIAGKAEDVLVEQVFKKLPSYTPVIGIADPPRAGLHRSVIHGIRRCNRMSRLIYVACNANNAFTNLVDLCRPVSKRIRTMPFHLVKAIPIDFFPHTQHCELIMLFERDKSVSKDVSRRFHLSVNNDDKR